MKWYLDKTYEIATTHFHRWYGLSSGLFLVLVLFLGLYKLIPDKTIGSTDYLKLIGVVGMVAGLIWARYAFWYPRRSKKRLGVVIAVQVEDFADRIFFEKDFLVPFQNKIKELELPFDVLVPKRHQVDKVNGIDEAAALMRKTKSHFCIWGSVKKRKIGLGDGKYVFLLRGMVVHDVIREVQKVLLVKEFDQLLPHKFVFEQELQFPQFEFRANQAVAALDYITGRAALLSGDFNTAISLHQPLLNALDRGEQFNVNKETLRRLLALEYDIRATSYYICGDMDGCRKNVEQTFSLDQNNYGALLKRAILEFDEGNGSPKKAFQTILLARGYSNGTFQWLYSEAFLHFWLEEYPLAISCCNKLKEKSYSGEHVTIREVTEFAEKILKKHNKPQIFYWLGFLAFTKDNNYPMADSWFLKFMDSHDTSMVDLKNRAESYLAITKKQIGY